MIKLIKNLQSKFELKIEGEISVDLPSIKTYNQYVADETYKVKVEEVYKYLLETIPSGEDPLFYTMYSGAMVSGHKNALRQLAEYLVKEDR